MVLGGNATPFDKYSHGGTTKISRNLKKMKFFYKGNYMKINFAAPTPNFF